MTRSEKIKEFLTGLDSPVDIMDYVDEENVNSFDDIYQQIEEAFGFEVEIICYARAMEYLMEHDNSLRESLGIASEYGFEVSGLSSEILASLLASRNAQDKFRELEDEINEFFEGLDEEEDDDEEEE